MRPEQAAPEEQAGSVGRQADGRRQGDLLGMLLLPPCGLIEGIELGRVPICNASDRL